MGLIERNGHGYYEVVDPTSGRTRFESLFLRDAEQFATGVYHDDKTICEISEVQRVTKP